MSLIAGIQTLIAIVKELNALKEALGFNGTATIAEMIAEVNSLKALVEGVAAPAPVAAQPVQGETAAPAV